MANAIPVLLFDVLYLEFGVLGHSTRGYTLCHPLQAGTWHAVSVPFIRPLSKIRDMACNTTSGLRTQNLALRTQPNIQRGAKTRRIAIHTTIDDDATAVAVRSKIRILARRAKPPV